MTIEKLRKLASNDPELTGKLNNAETFESLVYLADQVNEELSEEELSNVSGGVRSLGEFGLKKFMASDEAHACDTSPRNSCCSNCEPAHTCDTSTCKECGNCMEDSGRSLRFF